MGERHGRGDLLVRLAPLGPVAAWLVGMWLYYGEVISSGFDRLQGNIGDQRLLVYLSEHWFLALKGDEPWRDPSYFFPAKDVLGYTDTLFLFQPVYAPLRLLGVDQFVAFQVACMALTTIGFFAAYVLFRRIVGVRRFVAVGGAFAFAFANNLAVQSGHGQMYAVHLAPVVLLMLGESVRQLRADRLGRAAALGAGGGLLTALIFFTSFYVGMFMLIIGTACVVGVAVGAFPAVRLVVDRVRTDPKGSASLLVATVAGFVVGIVPFLATYVPVLDQSGGRQFDEVLALSPRVGDLLNLGRDNILWGQVLPALPVDAANRANGERAVAVTPLLWLSAVVLVVLVVVVAREPAVRLRARVAGGLLLGAAAVTAVSLRVGDGSLWWVVWRVLPGGKALRAVGRIEILLALVVTLAMVIGLDAAWTVLRRRVGKRGRAAVSAALLAVLLVVCAEQMVSTLHVDIDRSAELAALDVAPAPDGCTSFYVTDPPKGRPAFADQIDAMLLSHVVHIPTLNGYSGLAPLGWGMSEPERPDYETAVAAWREVGDVPIGVCTFDLTTRTWGGPSTAAGG